MVRSVVFSFAFLLLAQIFIFSDSSTDRLIRDTLRANYGLHFQEARVSTEALQEKYPDHPAGFLLAAEGYWWQAQANPDNKDVEKAYYAAQKLAVEKAEGALERNKYARIELLSYLASSWGSLARFQVTRKSAYFSALRAGIKALRYAREVHEMDHEYYDVYVGLGAYNYFTATLPAVIRPFAYLVGVRGRKELGFEQLTTAMEKSRYSGIEAKIVYYSVLLEEKRYAEALLLLDELIKEFPDNFVFYGWASSWFEMQHKFGDGIEYFESLARHDAEQSSLMAKHALLKKASLEHAARNDVNARQTLERVKAMPVTDSLIQSRLMALEKIVK